MRSALSTILRRGLLLVLALLMGVSLNLTVAGEPIARALGAAYFDADPAGECDVYGRWGGSAICDQVQVRLMVGETRFVRKSNAELRAYFNSPSGQITIYHKNWCPGSGGDYIQSGDNYDGNRPPGGTEITRYRIGRPGNWITHFGVHRYTSASSCAANATINVNSSHTRPAPGLPGKYFVDFLANNVPQGNGSCPNASGGLAGCDGIQNFFYVRITDGGNNYYLAQRGHESISDASTLGDRVTFQQKNTSPANVAYKVRFGSNCDTTPGKRYRLSFYDLDNNGGDGAQNNGKVKLRLYNATTGQWLWNRTSPAYGPGSNWANWRNVKPTYDEAFTPPSVANVDTYWDFQAQAGHRYVLELLNVYYNNTIQLSTPFDGVYWNATCQNPEARVRPQVGLSPNKSTYEVGDAVTATASIVNTTSNTGNTNNMTRRVWLDGGNQTCCNANDDVLFDATYTTNRQIPPSNYNLANLGAYQLNGQYAYICTSLINLRANNTANNGNPPVWTTVIVDDDRLCRPIGKYPSLQVRGGDIRTGGSFTEVGGVCSATPTSVSDFSVIGHNYVTSKGSFGEYGIVSAGRIMNFGANAVYSGGITSPNLMFGNRYHGDNTVDGLFYSVTPDLSLGSSMKTHCIPDVFASASYAFANPTSYDSSTVTVDTAAAGEVRYHHQFRGSNQTLTLNMSGALDDGKRRIVRITQDAPGHTGNRVVINGNITYADKAYASATQLPFFALIADGSDVDIQVNNSVSSLAGLYATRSDFVTCNAGAVGGIRGTANGTQVGNGSWCNAALSINGAVLVGGRIYPYRTAGQNTAADNTPAEIFNLRGDLLISEYLRKSQTAQMRATNQIELPPRF